MTSNICSVTATLLILISTLMLSPTSGAKILFIPANVNSHVLCFSRLAADLTQLGHVTRVLAPSNAHVPQFVGEVENGGNFSYTKYHVDGDEPYTNSRNTNVAIMRLAVSQSIWEQYTVMRSMLKGFIDQCESDCVHLLDSDHVMQQVREEGYQFSVVDPVVPQCYYAIPYSLGIPFATLSLPAITWTYRVPRLPSFAPLFGFTYTDRKSFVQRLTSFAVEFLMMLGKQLQNKTTVYVDRLAPDRPSLNAHQLVQQVKFLRSFSLRVQNPAYLLLPNVPKSRHFGQWTCIHNRKK